MTPDESKAMQQGPPFKNPWHWFEQWFTRAMEVASEAHACVVSTVGQDGMPSSRVVYMKEWDERGFVFYTNLTSQKGQEALGQKKAAMNFFWRETREQIRINGVIEQVSDVQADVYFASRARASQVGAWASRQSSPLASRETLLARTRELEQEYAGCDVPRPPHWSGLRLVPERIEFWRAGEHRLHDRFVFTRTQEGWAVERLNP